MIPPNFGPGLAIVEPSIKLHDLQLALAKLIVSPVNNRSVCKIMNPTNVARLFRRKTPLGVIQNLSIDSITVINDFIPSPDTTSESNVDSKLTHAEKCKILLDKGIILQQNSLTTKEFYKLVDLIFRNNDLFATSMHDFVGREVVKMHIDTGDAKPIRKRPYGQSPQMQQAMNKLIDEMLSANILSMVSYIICITQNQTFEQFEARYSTTFHP